MKKQRASGEFQVRLKSTLVTAIPTIATVDNGIDRSNTLGRATKEPLAHGTHARATTPWLVMRFLLSALAAGMPTTSNGSEGNRIQLEIIELVIVIHLPEEATHLL